MQLNNAHVSPAYLASAQRICDIQCGLGGGANRAVSPSEFGEVINKTLFGPTLAQSCSAQGVCGQNTCLQQVRKIPLAVGYHRHYAHPTITTNPHCLHRHGNHYHRSVKVASAQRAPLGGLRRTLVS